MPAQHQVPIEGPEIPWKGSDLRAWADIYAKKAERGEAEIKVDLLHHGIGSDDVTFRIRKRP